MTLTVIILPRNGLHMARAMVRAAGADRILVVDSGSTDNTVAIAREYGAGCLSPFRHAG